MFDFKALSTAQLVGIYNTCAAVTGATAVNRFADRAAAEKRTALILSTINPAQRPEPFNEGGTSANVAQTEETDTAPGVTHHAADPAISQAPGASDPLPDTTEPPVVEGTTTLNAEASAKFVEAVTDPKEPNEALKKAAEKAKDKAAIPPVKPSGAPVAVASTDPEKDREMPALKRSVRLIALDPKPTVYARKAGSKQAVLVDLLSRPEGATFGELYDAMKAAKGKPWQGVTIRSGLAWDMNNVAGYGISSEALNGEQFAAQGRIYEAQRLGFVGGGQGSLNSYNPDVKLLVYRLTYPKGVTGPVPHIQPKGKKSAEA